MTEYKSLIGGYFSSTPFDKSIPTSIRSNNPGAINGASWERNYPGYVDEVETTPGNKTTIFETPEQGIAAWWNLMRIYNRSGATTVRQIITKYGGGQDYSDYVVFVENKLPNQTVDINDDVTLLALAKAMFRYEAGQQIPWSDAQILYGIGLGRKYAKIPAPIKQPSKAGTAVIVGGAVAAAGGASLLYNIATAIIVIVLLFDVYVAIDFIQRYRATDASMPWYRRAMDAGYDSVTILWTKFCTIVGTITMFLDPLANFLGGDEAKEFLHQWIGDPKILAAVIFGITAITFAARMRSIWRPS